MSVAYLSNADLIKTGLGGAKLHAANLSWADLTGANLSGAKYNDLTIWPEGFS